MDTLAREATRYREGARWHGDMGTRGVNKYSPERQDPSGLLGFEMMSGFLRAWLKQVPVRVEGEASVIG